MIDLKVTKIYHLFYFLMNFSSRILQNLHLLKEKIKDWKKNGYKYQKIVRKTV